MHIFFEETDFFAIVMSPFHTPTHTFQYYLKLFHSICCDKCAMKILHVWWKFLQRIEGNLLVFYYLYYRSIKQTTILAFNDFHKDISLAFYW